MSEIPKNLTARDKTKLSTLGDISYTVRTPIAILREARKVKRDSGVSFPSAIATVERHRLETAFSITEPGEYTEDLTDTINRGVPRKLLNEASEGKPLVNNVINTIRELGNMNRKDIRRIRKSLKHIPQEHTGLGITGLEKAPIRRSLRALRTAATEMDLATDREIADHFKAFYQTTKDFFGHMLGEFDPETNTMIFVDKRFSLTDRWTAAHETAHGVYGNVLTSEQREEWKEISKKAITLYAEHVTDEDKADENFSEMYAMYLHNRLALKLWSLINQDVKRQYNFFTFFMPKRTKFLPTTVGILHPLLDRAGKSAIKGLDKATGLSITELSISEAATDIADIYNPDYDGQTKPDTIRKNTIRISKLLFGNENPDDIDQAVLSYQVNEFMKRHLPLIHFSRRMQAFLMRNGIWQKAYQQATETQRNGHSAREIVNDADDLLAAYGLSNFEEKLDTDNLQAYPLFLKNRVLLLTPNGKIRIPYKPEVKAAIKAALRKDHIEGDTSPISVVQMDAVRALQSPSFEDTQARKNFEKEYQVPLLNSTRRGFSKNAVGVLANTLNLFPKKDVEQIAGFKRVRDKNGTREEKGSKVKIKGKSKRSIIPIDDIGLTDTPEALSRYLGEIVAGLVLQNDRELFKKFVEASGWEKVKSNIPNRIFFTINQKGMNNPIFQYRINHEDSTTFLIPLAGASLTQDFATCYTWFILNNEEFRERARTNPVLQKKYATLAEHFAPSQTDN